MSLANELVITGLPFNRGENAGDIVGDIVRALNCDLRPNDFASIYRVSLKQPRSALNKNIVSTPIIVRFYYDDAKQHMLSSYFDRKNLNLADIGYKTSSRIYINESLTETNREIFKVAAEAKRSRKLNKFFTRLGLVYIKMAAIYI